MRSTLLVCFACALGLDLLMAITHQFLHCLIVLWREYILVNMIVIHRQCLNRRSLSYDNILVHVHGLELLHGEVVEDSSSVGFAHVRRDVETRADVLVCLSEPTHCDGSVVENVLCKCQIPGGET